MTPPRSRASGQQDGRDRLLQREAQVIHPAPGGGVHGDPDPQQPLGGVDERLARRPVITPLASSSSGSEVPKRAVAAQRPTQRSRMPPGPFLRSGSRRKMVSPKRLWRAVCSARRRATKSSAAVLATRLRNASRKRRAQLLVAGQEPGVEQGGGRRRDRWPAGRAPGRTTGRHARRRPWRPTAGRGSPRPASGPPVRASWRTRPGGRDRSRAPAHSGRSRRSRRPPPACCTSPPPGRPPRRRWHRRPRRALWPPRSRFRRRAPPRRRVRGPPKCPDDIQRHRDQTLSESDGRHLTSVGACGTVIAHGRD